MNIYLVRHTEFLNPNNVYYYHLPIVLSPNGRKKARGIGKWLHTQGANNLCIYTSPLVRCVQTSELIAHHTNAMVYVDPRIIEVACPAKQGTPLLPNGFAAEEDDPSYEGHEAVRTRVMETYNECLERGADTIFVSHGTPTTILYRTLMNIPIPRYLWVDSERKHNIEKGEVVHIKLDNKLITSITRHLP